MTDMVSYEVTGVMDNQLIVKFTMGHVVQSGPLTWDGTVDLDHFLKEQATLMGPLLKRRMVNVDLTGAIGRKGSAEALDLKNPPPPRPM